MSSVVRNGNDAHSAGHGASYDTVTIRQLNALTNEFYTQEAASFSATRQAPWQGWNEAWDIVSVAVPTFATKPLTVLDLGCGNLRFERFLSEKTTGPVTVHAFDNCPALAEAPADHSAGTTIPVQQHPTALAPLTIHFQQLDLVEALLAGNLAAQLPLGTCNLAVAFGLMHHLPTFTLRAHTLETLLRSLRPDGFAIVSFWQFLNDERLAEKAVAATAEGHARCNLPPFAPNDYLLGWQHAEGIYRFCHHTPDEEIDELLAALSLPHREIARFSADGKQGTLNRYVVLQRH